mmetsp:Transcript_23710/g.50747  ORF Transcript_23710/g.50747 Transcript_23710/m.50747 type:complete len:254 (+) Transcript_23710:131-892(+)|eukprot:CAMPEP_0172540348 /NCGR_PEP_ID=MMETSP1067-20121228/11395_1 /TAXON_ID=265564 ORGANISM="Thalassiosira punctigera, Strain Tpunct2005C2" /NCGR_SAMPLE_ID=MMETSP1067 /ASSEMBLY_ACC=CAM_ASM_000444 /LENGTH=253 /DNA_ID=CAMNT_0013326201 /DNA_START=112 /DNA_END=873 /DNA_ORIENTATION=+
MDYSKNHHQYGGGDDDRSLGSRASRATNQSSIGMASSAANKAHGATDKGFMASAPVQFAAPATTQNSSSVKGNDDGLAAVERQSTEDALAAEAEGAVTKERQLLYKENAARLQSILENIKNSTKSILREMDAYLQETEDVEKTFIRCRANTQKESERMERVEPDVIAATQRFVAQGAQLFGGAGGSMDFMNMAALMGASGAGGGSASMGMPSIATGGNGAGGAASLMGMPSMVTPRGNDGASMAGSSMAGSTS